MKLNLGCGFNKRPGYINVDKFGEPDIRHDLESFPWPWQDNLFEEVQLIHVLEHLGKDPDSFVCIIKELFRICKNGARIFVAVPHPRHDDFLSDPTHVRPITPLLMSLFSRRENLNWQAANAANSLLALYHNVDFELRNVTYVLESRYAEALSSGRLSKAEIDLLVLERNNVATEIRMELEVIKAVT